MTRWLPFTKKEPLVAIVRLQGAIAATGGTLSDKSLSSLIERAFKKGKPSAVALEINSPGGSPVQSSLIAGRIRRLSEEKKVPVFAFVEDVAASGGYWLATAADEIYVDPASIVGSIGVISSGFGLQDFIGRYGIERRVHTAGTSKSFHDPFRAEKEEDVARLKTLLENMHVIFKEQVAGRRAGKLPEDEDLFTGEFWLGQTAIEKGLADGVGHLVPEMKKRFGDKVRFRRYEAKKGLFSRFGRVAVDEAVAGIEERAAFARFGL